MGKFFIYGAGGHAVTVWGTAEICGIEISGFIDDFSNGADCCFMDKPVYSPEILQKGDTVFMGFGDNFMRQKRGCDLLQRGIQFPPLIHPSAVISPYASIGNGCYVGANAVIDPLCRIGCFTIINNGATVAHQTVIGEAVNICPGSAVAGNVEVADRVWIGIGSSVIEKIKIANDVYIGGGSVVVSDLTEENALYYGVPARLGKKRTFSRIIP